MLNHNLKPEFITFGLTDRCNSRCSKCVLWRTKDKSQEWDIATWIRMTNRLADWLGPFELNIAGGEPLLKRGCLDLVSCAMERGLSTSLLSGGVPLTDRIVSKIIAAGPSRLVLSLDGPAEVSDKIKGVKGSTERIFRAIDRVKSSNPMIKIQIIVVIMRQNIALLSDFIESLVADPRVDLCRLQAVVQPLGEKEIEFWYRTSDLWPKDNSMVERSFKQLMVLHKSSKKIANTAQQLNLFWRYFVDPDRLRTIKLKCAVGNNTFFINPSGEIRLCTRMSRIGMIDDDPMTVWTSEHADQIRVAINTCNLSCHQLINCCYVDETSGIDESIENITHPSSRIADLRRRVTSLV